MKYIIIDDNNQLYKMMYRDILKPIEEFDVEEIPREKIEGLLHIIYKIHTASRCNQRIQLPFKGIWSRFYGLSQYMFDESEQYCVIILNGTLWKGYTYNYLKKFKIKNPNVKLALIFHDSMNVLCYRKSVEERLELFDYTFSFDEEDCDKYGFTHFYQVFSKPDFVCEDNGYKTDVFLAANGAKRVRAVHDVFVNLCKVCNPYVIMTNVDSNEQIIDEGNKYIIYNKPISYRDELQYAYNTNCMLEIVNEGQSGITLRTVEAVCFNKKLLTNNIKIKNMPFYDSRYMKLISELKDTKDYDKFINDNSEVHYEHCDYFSPIMLLRMIDKMISAR